MLMVEGEFAWHRNVTHLEGDIFNSTFLDDVHSFRSCIRDAFQFKSYLKRLKDLLLRVLKLI